MLPNILNRYLKDVQNIQFIIFAYEPIYAIGTGALPNVNKIREVTSFVSKYLEDKYKIKPVILYGGSVDSSNISDIINIDSIDGVLVGNVSSDIKEVDRIFERL